MIKTYVISYYTFMIRYNLRQKYDLIESACLPQGHMVLNRYSVSYHL